MRLGFPRWEGVEVFWDFLEILGFGSLFFSFIGAFVAFRGCGLERRSLGFPWDFFFVSCYLFLV